MREEHSLYVRRTFLYYKNCAFELILRCRSVRYAYIFYCSAAKLSPKLLHYIYIKFLTYLERGD